MPNNHSLQSENLAKLKEVLDKRYYGTSPFTNLDSTDEGKVIGVVKNRQGEYEAKPVSMNPASCPIGSIIAWPTPTIPVGFLVCNGQAVSRVSFKKLFDKIGITYGAGDGSTTFNVPDLRDKFIEGGNIGDANLDNSIPAGLPNITGQVGTSLHTSNGSTDPTTQDSGALEAYNTAKNINGLTGTSCYTTAIKLNAHNSNEIYGNSNTVQPPAIKMLYIICTGDSVPESIVDSMHLANTDGNSTIKFGKDNQGNYGYYKGDDPTFNPFINPGDIHTTYEEIGSGDLTDDQVTIQCIKKPADYDALYVCVYHNTSSADIRWGAGRIIPMGPQTFRYQMGVPESYGTMSVWTTGTYGVIFSGASTGSHYAFAKVYGIKYKCEVEPPTSMKLSTDLTKEIRFGQEDNLNGYYVDDDTFVPFIEGGQTLYQHSIYLVITGGGSYSGRNASVFLTLITTSATPLTNSTVIDALKDRHGDSTYFSAESGYINRTSDSKQGPLCYIRVNGSAIDVFGSISDSTVATTSAGTGGSISVADTVKVIGAAAVSSLPTAPSANMFLMSNSTGEGEWRNLVQKFTPTFVISTNIIPASKVTTAPVGEVSKIGNMVSIHLVFDIASDGVTVTSSSSGEKIWLTHNIPGDYYSGNVVGQIGNSSHTYSYPCVLTANSIYVRIPDNLTTIPGGHYVLDLSYTVR